MLTPTSVIFLIVLCGLMGYHLIKSWLSSDRSAIWSPITVITLTLVYYIVMPSFYDINLYGAKNVAGQHLFFVGALIFYISVKLGFSIRQKSRFKKWNNYLNQNNAQACGILLFLFALVCYIPFRGFRTTIWAEDAYMLSAREGFVSYFIDLISVFCASCGTLFLFYKASNYRTIRGFSFFVVLYMTLVMYIVGGFRVRLVYLILSLATVYHLFPKPRRLNYPLVASVAVFAYLGFAVMEVSRQYGSGIVRAEAMNVSLSDARHGARENLDVLCFSIVSMDEYNENGGYVLFEPIVNAVFMPIPRAVFPWKPDGEYIRQAQLRTIGGWEGGAAFLCFVEAFISFGWIGIFLYGIFIGWVSGIFWSNYKRTPDSMGAILLLSLYNGFCYNWISRGYMGGNFNSFLYYVIVPFWLIALFRSVMPSVFAKQS